jgi:hypothetical protein
MAELGSWGRILVFQVLDCRSISIHDIHYRSYCCVPDGGDNQIGPEMANRHLKDHSPPVAIVESIYDAEKRTAQY